MGERGKSKVWTFIYKDHIIIYDHVYHLDVWNIKH